VGGELLELLLDAPAALHRPLEVPAELCAGPFAVGVEQFQKPGHRLADSLGVTLREVRSESELVVDRVDERPLAQLAHRLGQVVRDEPVVVGEQLRLKLRCFPSGEVVVHSIEKSRIDHCVRQIGEEVCVTDEFRVRSAGVADEYCRRLGNDLVAAARERGRFHVVLQHLDDR
jgi:hypothetical protein